MAACSRSRAFLSRVLRRRSARTVISRSTNRPKRSSKSSAWISCRRCCSCSASFMPVSFSSRSFSRVGWFNLGIVLLVSGNSLDHARCRVRSPVTRRWLLATASCPGRSSGSIPRSCTSRRRWPVPGGWRPPGGSYPSVCPDAGCRDRLASHAAGAAWRSG